MLCDSFKGKIQSGQAILYNQYILFHIIADNKEKDTPEAVLKEVTFKPKLCTFEQEIMEKMGIKEDRKPARTFWY